MCVSVCILCGVHVCVFALVPWCGSQIKLPEVSFYLHHVGLEDRIQITLLGSKTFTLLNQPIQMMTHSYL